jgi:hypothetical protein
MESKNIKEEIPVNKKTRNPTVKKTFSLDDYKKKQNIVDAPDKELIWIPASDALQTSTGLPGFPKGYVSLARGFTNTGKSTALCEAIVSAQKMGILPIIIDTENNLGRERLEKMGFDWGGNYIEIDNDVLLENFGKKQDKKRKEASIEDMAACIHFYLDEQESGNLPFDLLFAIDSLGTLDCISTIKAEEKNTNNNNMWNAGAFEKSFKYLLNNTLPSSRKQNKEYTNTVIGVQKIWIDSMGMGVVKHKGGETFYYGSRLIYHFGGVATHGSRKVTATSKGREIAYGIETKVTVAKNQIDCELGGVSFEGEIISTPKGFILKEDVDNFKKENLLFFRTALGDQNIDAEDIKDNYVELKQNESFDME